MPPPEALVPDLIGLRFIQGENYRRLVAGAPLVVIDGGSRGGLFEPFRSVGDGVVAIGFDPDPETASEGTVPKALWSGSGQIRVHLAADRSMSSVYPPNIPLLEEFPAEIGLPARGTEEIVEVESMSIDEAVAAGLCPPPAFIKLSTELPSLVTLASLSHRKRFSCATSATGQGCRKPRSCSPSPWRTCTGTPRMRSTSRAASEPRARLRRATAPRSSTSC
jgi:hypothetical protein